MCYSYTLTRAHTCQVKQVINCTLEGWQCNHGHNIICYRIYFWLANSLKPSAWSLICMTCIWILRPAIAHCICVCVLWQVLLSMVIASVLLNHGLIVHAMKIWRTLKSEHFLIPITWARKLIIFVFFISGEKWSWSFTSGSLTWREGLFWISVLPCDLNVGGNCMQLSHDRIAETLVLLHISFVSWSFLDLWSEYASMCVGFYWSDLV